MKVITMCLVLSNDNDDSDKTDSFSGSGDHIDILKIKFL